MVDRICLRCGVQSAASVGPPVRCAICEDEREAVCWEGQRWTTLADLRRGHQNVLRPLEAGLAGIHTEPRFAIGQQALLVRTPHGNVLWDCLSMIDDATIAAVQAAGSLAAIASSHPHFHGALVEWRRASGGILIYLHAADRAWVMRPDSTMVFWEGATYPLAPGLTLIHCAGILPVRPCFTGPRVPRGGACCAPAIRCTWSKTAATSPIMYSYVNYVPLSGSTVRRIIERLVPFRYDRIYGCFVGLVLASDARGAVARSAARYLRAIDARGNVRGERPRRPFPFKAAKRPPK